MSELKPPVPGCDDPSNDVAVYITDMLTSLAGLARKANMADISPVLLATRRLIETHRAGGGQG